MGASKTGKKRGVSKCPVIRAGQIARMANARNKKLAAFALLQLSKKTKESDAIRILCRKFRQPLIITIRI
jgi:hypothetical protein